MDRDATNIPSDSTCYVERSMVRIGVMGTGDEALLKWVDELPIFTASDFTHDAKSAPVSREQMAVETELFFMLTSFMDDGI